MPNENINKSLQSNIRELMNNSIDAELGISKIQYFSLNKNLPSKLGKAYIHFDTDYLSI